MSGDRHLTRRRFLLLSAAGGAFLACRRILPGGWFDSPPRPAPASERLLGLLRDGTSARDVGAAYLETLPFGTEARGLAESIVTELEGGTGALEATESELRSLVARRVQQDFAEDATVCVRGWIVSRTEARMCALAALS